MPISTISQTILRGDISIYLSANDNAKGNIFSHRIASPGSPVTIALVTDALRWGSDGGAQTEQDVRQMANYLIWLIGIYGQKAEYISQGTGGGSVIIPSNGGILPLPLDFIVDDTTSPILTGGNTITLPTFVGYNVDFYRGAQTQYTTNPGDGSTFYSWNRSTGVFACFPAATLGEQFRIVPIG